MLHSSHMEGDKKVIRVRRISLKQAEKLRRGGYTVLLAGTRQVIETLKIRAS